MGVVAGHVPILLLGAAVAGLASHGWIYIGGLGKVSEVAPGSAAAVSGFFLGAYVGFGVPAAVVGYAVDLAGCAAAFVVFFAAICIGSVLVGGANRPRGSSRVMLFASTDLVMNSPH